MARYEVTVLDSLVNASPEALNRVLALAPPAAKGRLHFFQVHSHGCR
jgi:hypothetical protein